MNSTKIIFFILSVVFLLQTITTVHADTEYENNKYEIKEPLMLFCANNPISDKYNMDDISAANIIKGCKEKLDGYSWGSRIYMLIYAPGWNTDTNKINTLGNTSEDTIKARTREGSISLKGAGCNGFVETAPNSGLFYGSIKLSGVRMDITGDGSIDVFGGNGCIKGTSVIKDGSGKVQAKQDGTLNVSFEYAKDKFVTKNANYSWREATLVFDKTEYDVTHEVNLTLTDLDNVRFPFDDKFSYQIHVYSDTDQAGVVMDVFWVANYKGIVQMNGHYPLKFTLTTDDDSYASKAWQDSGRLRVSPGDTIYAKYIDRTLPLPYSNNDSKTILSSATVFKPIDGTPYTSQQQSSFHTHTSEQIPITSEPSVTMISQIIVELIPVNNVNQISDEKSNTSMVYTPEPTADEKSNTSQIQSIKYTPEPIDKKEIKPQCGIGTKLVNGFCKIIKPDDCFLFLCR